MKELALIAVMVGSLKVTAYRSVPKQTDSTPFNTSTGERVRVGGVAASRDILCGACRKLHRQCEHPEYAKKLHYGQWLYVDQIGFLQINDVMGDYSTQKVKGRKVRIPLRNRLDVWVRCLEDEKQFQKTFRCGSLDVWKISIKKENHYGR